MLRPLCLALWGVVLLASGFSGRLDLLVHSLFHPLIAATGMALLILAVMDVLLNRPSQRRPQRRERAAWLSGAAVALAMVLLPPNPSFADLAGNRTNEQATHQEELSFVLPPAQRSLTDWVRLLRAQPDPSLYAGEPVNITGFVLPIPGEAPQLARLLVRCCLADATPFGLPVRWPPNQPVPRADSWLTLTGVMGTETLAGQTRSVVVPERIIPIRRPARPFE